MVDFIPAHRRCLHFQKRICCHIGLKGQHKKQLLGITLTRPRQTSWLFPFLHSSEMCMQKRTQLAGTAWALLHEPVKQRNMVQYLHESARKARHTWES